MKKLRHISIAVDTGIPEFVSDLNYKLPIHWKQRLTTAKQPAEEVRSVM